MHKDLAKVKDLMKISRHKDIKIESLDRLKKLARKKFRTSFIFPLAEFERIFGEELWGHNLSEEFLTDAQKNNRIKWEKVRTAILNNGNTQSRALEAEISLHDIMFKGYHIELGEHRNG